VGCGEPDQTLRLGHAIGRYAQRGEAVVGQLALRSSLSAARGS